MKEQLVNDYVEGRPHSHPNCLLVLDHCASSQRPCLGYSNGAELMIIALLDVDSTQHFTTDNCPIDSC
jgi:hypothetical protein